MNKAEKKFRLYAILVIFVLLTVLLAVINGVNFTMAADDADELTRMLSNRQDAFEHGESLPEDTAPQQKDRNFRMGPMGPDSPEMNASLRYFTVAFSEKGEKVETTAFRISAVTESEAQEWAAGLLKEKTGWTRGTYRYRVYKKGKVTYVTVIDQGRELLPSFRILIISAVGEILVLLIGWFVLLMIGRKIYAPIEEADRKQKNFIKNANKEFRLPLTVISGNTELTERRYGPDDQTRSTRRQLGKLNELVDKLGTIGIFNDDNMNPVAVPLSEYLSAALDSAENNFASRGLELKTDIAPDVMISADPEATNRMIDELIKNALEFALTFVSFTLKIDSGYVLLETKNDASLPEGPADQAFDRFTKLENAAEERTGLGLSYVKEIVQAHNGRTSASVSNGIFTLRITL
ncbi:MAG: HAMP domain-containing histidine kinase [Clostridia bacterium]|nr:HAMP domain-containing histidine kinase [Clostridia bacterium]